MSSTLVKFKNYLFDDETKRFLLRWINLMLSVRGVWFFLPALLGTLGTYYFMYHGYADTEATIKPLMESFSVQLIATAAAIFLIRFIFTRTRLDFLLFIMTANFMCREIKFAGTEEGVFVVFLIVLILAIKWKHNLIQTVDGADWFLIVLGTVMFSYFYAFLVQRGAFTHVLPNEDQVSEGLEEVLENVGHFMFVVLAIVSFFSLQKQKIVDK